MTFASNLKTQILLLVDVAYVALLQFAMCMCVYKKCMHLYFVHWLFTLRCSVVATYASLQTCVLYCAWFLPVVKFCYYCFVSKVMMIMRVLHLSSRNFSFNFRCPVNRCAFSSYYTNSLPQLFSWQYIILMPTFIDILYVSGLYIITLYTTCMYDFITYFHPINLWALQIKLLKLLHPPVALK